MKRMKHQRGGFMLGLVIGLLLGLSLSLAVALYITKVPVPFINKVPQRTAEQDQAEQQRNRSWDPNAPLASKPLARPAAASGAASAALAAASAPAAATPTPRAPAAASAAAARDPAAILSGADPARAASTGFNFFVQAGAYARSDEAEQQRARLAMLGYSASISARDQHGRTVYRVRIGPFETRDEAEGQQSRLLASSIESQLVRVERP